MTGRRRGAAVMLGTCLLVVASLARAEAPSPTRVIPAMAAVQAGDTLAVYAPDLRSVLGLGPDGARRWRVPTGDQGGLRDLDVLPDGARAHVLVYAGEEALVVDAASGKVLGRRAEVRLGSPGGPRGCFVVHEEGVCAVACECSFAVVDCTTLASLGEPARLPHFEEPDADGTPRSHCPMFSGALLGRAGDTLVTSYPAATDKPFFSVPEIVVARHATSGVERWRSSEIGFFDEELSGVTRDGVCYAGSRAGTLTVFDCQRATVAWRRTSAAPRGGMPQVEAVADGLLVRDGARVMLLDAATGAARWDVAVPATSIVLLAGAEPAAGTLDRRMPDGVRGARILDPKSGATLGDLALDPSARRWPRRSSAGWLVIGDTRVDLYDDDGKSIGGLASPHGYDDLIAGEGARVAAWQDDGVTVATLGVERGVVTIDAPRAHVVAFEGPLGRGRLALMQDGRGPWDPKDPATFGELRLYRLDP